MPPPARNWPSRWASASSAAAAPNRKVVAEKREWAWPSRSAKVVLQLALDRLVHHYVYATRATGPAHAAIRTWLAEGEAFSVDGG
ncbi:MAG TPA: DUF6456 domain-containing protein [Pseudolabrys sp.]